MEIIILSYGYYQINNLNLSIDYYFVTTNNNINFKCLKFFCLIEYNNPLSGIITNQTKEVNCFFENTMINNKYKIPCSVRLDNTSFILIDGIHELFTFEDDNNIEVVGVSPLASFIDKDIANLIDSFDQRVYILDHSLYNKNSKYFNISGIINEPFPNITYNDLILYVNDLDKKDNIKKINCSIINVNKTNYILTCEEIENSTISLQSATSFINDNGDILLIKFDKNNDSIFSGFNDCLGIDFFN